MVGTHRRRCFSSSGTSVENTEHLVNRMLTVTASDLENLRVGYSRGPSPRWFFQRRGANFSRRISQWKSVCNSRSLVSFRSRRCPFSFRSRGTTAARNRRTIPLTCNLDRRRKMWLSLQQIFSQITLRCDDVSRCDCVLECDPRCFSSSSGLPTRIEEPVCFNRGGMVRIRPPDARRPPHATPSLDGR